MYHLALRLCRSYLYRNQPYFRMKNILVLGITERYFLGRLQSSRKKKVVKEEWHTPVGEKVELAFLYSLHTAITYILCHTHIQHIHTHSMKRQPACPFKHLHFSTSFLTQTFIRLDYFF